MAVINPVWLPSMERLQVTTCSLDLSTENLPKATITIPASGVVPKIHDYIQIADPRGTVHTLRVVSYNYNYGQTVTLQLIGAADSLSDDVYNVIAEEAETKTATQWLALILAKQTVTRWQLGTCAMPDSVAVKIKTNYQDLWTLMETVRQTRPGYWWTFDYSTYPWTISLAALPDVVASEVRLSRNIESAQISISDQELCNKLVFTVSDDNGVSAVSVYDDAASQAAYGVRTRCTDIKSDEIPSGMTAAEYAVQELSKNSSPIVTVQISGADLSNLTGEPLDQITLGAKCRAVLPELGAPVVERVVSLSWPDLYNAPDHIKVTLSTEPASLTGSIANAKKMAEVVKRSGGGGGGRKADKDGWAMVLTDTIEAVDGTGINQLWQSGIQMTSHGGVRIFSLYEGTVALDSEVKINNTNISAEVTRATAAEGTLSGRITVNAGKIGLVVEETSSGNVIKAAEITAAINDAGSSVVIKADHIELVGSGIKLGNVITADSNGAVINASMVNATTMGATTGEFATVRTLYGNAYRNLSMQSTTVVTDASTGATTTIHYLGLAPT